MGDIQRRCTLLDTVIATELHTALQTLHHASDPALSHKARAPAELCDKDVRQARDPRVELLHVAGQPPRLSLKGCRLRAVLLATFLLALDRGELTLHARALAVGGFACGHQGAGDRERGGGARVARLPVV